MDVQILAFLFGYGAGFASDAPIASIDFSGSGKLRAVARASVVYLVTNRRTRCFSP